MKTESSKPQGVRWLFARNISSVYAVQFLGDNHDEMRWMAKELQCTYTCAPDGSAAYLLAPFNHDSWRVVRVNQGDFLVGWASSNNAPFSMTPAEVKEMYYAPSEASEKIMEMGNE